MGEEPPYFCTESLNYLYENSQLYSCPINDKSYCACANVRYEDILHAPLNLSEELECVNSDYDSEFDIFGCIVLMW